MENNIVVHRESPPKEDEDKNQKPFQKYGKMIFLFLVWFFVTAVLTYQPEKDLKMKQLSIPISGYSKHYILPTLPISTRIGLNLEGGFLKEKFNNRTENFLSIYLQSVNSYKDKDLPEWSRSESVKNISEVFHIPVIEPDLIEHTPATKKNLIFMIGEDNLEFLKETHGLIRIIIQSNFYKVMPIKVKYDYAPVNIDVGVIYAAFALIFLYGLIIWEVSIFLVLAIFFPSFNDHSKIFLDCQQSLCSSFGLKLKHRYPSCTPR